MLIFLCFCLNQKWTGAVRKCFLSHAEKGDMTRDLIFKKVNAEKAHYILKEPILGAWEIFLLKQCKMGSARNYKYTALSIYLFLLAKVVK